MPVRAHTCQVHGQSTIPSTRVRVQLGEDQRHIEETEGGTQEQLAAKDLEIAQSHREIAELRRQLADRTG